MRKRRPIRLTLTVLLFLGLGLATSIAIAKYLDLTQSGFGGSEAYLLHHGVQQSVIDNFLVSMLE